VPGADPIHIHPVAPLAERVLLPGDPGRALQLAQVLLDDDRRMFNHHRGLWGYTGTGADGRPLTIQSTGMGGPSAAIVLEELAAAGATCAVRVGTGTALNGDLALGDLVTADAVLGADGTSRALGAPERQTLDPGLARRLGENAARTGLIVSTDLFYDPDAARSAAWEAGGALAVDLEAAALAAVAARHGLPFGCVLAVAATRGDAGSRLEPDALEAAGAAAGQAAAAALAAG
jgi:uridine phosphorylase